MASKVIPTLLLLGFLVIVVISFHPSPTQRVATNVLPRHPRPVRPNVEYEMKKYWMVLLKKGPRREQSKEVAAQIQRAHLANITRLAVAGKVVLAGPFEGDGDIRGILVMDCKDSVEAANLVNTDSAVITGRLAYDLKPWWTAKNCLFK